MKRNVSSLLQWLGNETIEFFQNFSRDLRSIRGLFNWIYLILFVWLVVYTALNYKEGIPTALTCTATIVGVIFSGYIYSKKEDKRMMLENENAKIPKGKKATKPDPNEDGASA